MKKIISVLIILGSPIIILPLLFIFIVPVLIAGVVGDEDNVSDSTGGYGYVMCNDVQEIDYSKWAEQFEKAGVLSNHANDFERYAEEYNIDPILFASIAMHETGWGTSSAVVNHNNPGGLMNPDTNWSTIQHFPTLKEGIEAMARNLSRLINEEGLVTISELGSVYAPLDAENDPDGLNQHWYPRVTEYVNDFGGLTKNCEVLGEVELVGNKAWIVPHTKNITSHFRTSHRPNHNGIDIASGDVNGKPVVAFMDGEVITSTSQGTTFVSSSSNMGYGYGWYVAIDHGNGIETRYAHLLEQGLPVGSEVKAGEVIGRVGSTGGSTGPHLHFEILVNGQFVDPMNYLDDFLQD